MINEFLVNLFLFAGVTICIVAAIFILLPVLIVAGVLVLAALPMLVVGCILVLLGGFIDAPSECSYNKKNKKGN